MISKEEQAKRITRTFEDFSLILPVYSEEQRRIVRMTMQKDLAILIPAWFSDLATACLVHQESFIEYLKFIIECGDYILGKTDSYTPPDYDPVLREKLDQELKVMRINEMNRQKKLVSKQLQEKIGDKKIE